MNSILLLFLKKSLVRFLFWKIYDAVYCLRKIFRHFWKTPEEIVLGRILLGLEGALKEFLLEESPKEVLFYRLWTNSSNENLRKTTRFEEFLKELMLEKSLEKFSFRKTYVGAPLKKISKEATLKGILN